MDAVEKSLRIGGCGRMCKNRRIVGRVGRVLVTMHRESGTQIWINHNTATQPKEKPTGERTHRFRTLSPCAQAQSKLARLAVPLTLQRGSNHPRRTARERIGAARPGNVTAATSCRKDNVRVGADGVEGDFAAAGARETERSKQCEQMRSKSVRVIQFARSVATCTDPSNGSSSALSRKSGDATCCT